MSSSSLDEFEKAIEEYVRQMLPDPEILDPVRDSKVIHDAVWGTHVFNAFEIALIDTPLIQRLRGIHQTGFAYLTYPAAHHTRFEHSLGVTILADKMLNALFSNDGTPNPTDLAYVRIAGILHDCGHGMLSHIAERQIENHPWIQAYRKKDKSRSKPKTHELLSHAIISSSAFKEYFDKIKKIYHKKCRDVLDVIPERVADLVIGKEWHYEKKYLADVINGPFDADKLDYFTRDAYFTGLKTTLDIDRLLYATTIKVVDEPWLKKKCEKRKDDPAIEEDRRAVASKECPKRLVVLSSGTSALEQILFSKMQLFTTVYHHHKVRSAESMLACCVDYAKAMSGNLRPEERLENPIDFLKYTDWEWLYRATEDAYISAVTRRLTERTLFKRALVISRRTVDTGLEKFTRIQKGKYARDIYNGLREKILERVSSKMTYHDLTKYDIVVDAPSQPSLREAEQTPIIFKDGSLGVLNDMFPADDWLASYYTHKWNSHVLCIDSRPQVRLYVAAAAKAVFEKELGMSFNENAFKFANLKPSDIPSI